MSSTTDEYGDEATDCAVLASLLSDECMLWSVEEIAREIGDHPAVTDSLKRLHRAGLIHRCNEFVFPSRPARRFEELRA